jgi:hypothetical protein
MESSTVAEIAESGGAVNRDGGTVPRRKQAAARTKEVRDRARP